MKKSQKAFDLEKFLATVNGGRTLATYRKDDIVFSQGDRCDAVFYIRSGKCKVSVVSEQGKEAIVAMHEKGDFFGEGCLTGQPLRLATVIALADLEVLRFDNAAMHARSNRSHSPSCSLLICSQGMRVWKLT